MFTKLKQGIVYGYAVKLKQKKKGLYDGSSKSWCRVAAMSDRFALLSFLLSLTKRNHLVTPTLLGLQNLEKFSKELLEIKSCAENLLKT